MQVLENFSALSALIAALSIIGLTTATAYSVAAFRSQSGFAYAIRNSRTFEELRYTKVTFRTRVLRSLWICAFVFVWVSLGLGIHTVLTPLSFLDLISINLDSGPVSLRSITAILTSLVIAIAGAGAIASTLDNHHPAIDLTAELQREINGCLLLNDFSKAPIEKIETEIASTLTRLTEIEQRIAKSHSYRFFLVNPEQSREQFPLHEIRERYRYLLAVLESMKKLRSKVSI